VNQTTVAKVNIFSVSYVIEYTVQYGRGCHISVSVVCEVRAQAEM